LDDIGLCKSGKMIHRYGSNYSSYNRNNLNDEDNKENERSLREIEILENKVKII
jgi:hypothetical protein